MRLISLSLAVLGLATGLFFALGPWIFGTPMNATLSFIGPFVLGAVLCVVHWLSLRRIRSGSGKRMGLLAGNSLLLAFMVLGGFLIHLFGIGGRYVVSVLYVLLYLLPLTSNVIFLVAARNTGRESRAS